jgi:xanthine dehydrogenase small subunit
MRLLHAGHRDASLHALWLAKPNPSEADIERQLQGNLCRCTGYEPIIKAAIAAAATYRTPTMTGWSQPMTARSPINSRTLRMARGSRHRERAWRDLPLPADLDHLAELYASHPEATIVAGSTDVGLWVNQAHARHFAGHSYRPSRCAQDHHHRDRRR